MIRLPPATIVGPDDALKYLIDAGLCPIWIWPPEEGEKCTCGKTHSASGKHPIAKSWQKRATFDELADQLARFKFTPNIGIVLGDQPGGEYLIAVDVDDEPRLAAITTDLGPLPETVRGESGRGHRLLFELGNEVNRDELRNITGLCGEPGVDVKIKGGQVVVAPSLHLSGKRYTWSKFGEIARLPSAWALSLLPKSYTVPPWVEGYTPTTMKEDKRAKKRAEKYLERAVLSDASLLASSREGTRNTVLHKSVVRLLSLCAGLQLPEHWAWVQREMHRAALAAGLRDSEIARTISSAERYVRESGAVRFPVGLKDPPRAKSTGPAPEPEPPREEPPAEATGEASPPPPPPADTPPPAGGFDGDPLEGIHLSMDRGSPAKTAGNVYMMLAMHPVWCGGPKLDSYSQTEIWPMPLPTPISNIHRIEREIVDADHAAVQAWLMGQPDSHRVRVGIDTVTHGLRLAASRASVDLLRDWINRLPPWDGSERLGTWTTRYLGCPDTPYARATGKAWMVAAIERALVPGSVVDVIPVLEGGQKSGKNYALEVLFAGGPTWAPFIQIIAGQDLEKPETLRLACTRWVLHDDELRARDPKRVDALKSWASRTRETFRLPYSREITVAGRRALLVTSTNLETYLHDETGNRRWWPWATGNKIDVPSIDRDRLQLFAEALHLVLNTGAGWRDGVEAIYEETLSQSDSRRVRDPLVEKISMIIAQGRIADPITTNTIGTTLGFPVDRIDRALETRVGAAMRELGYHTSRVTGPDGVRVRAYVKDS